MKFWKSVPLIASLFATATVSAGTGDLLDVEIRPLLGKEPVNLKQTYQGKVLLIVNVASKCGFTKQYEGLESIYQKYHDQGFEVLGFPCNQFLGQEPGTEAEIQKFCESTYGVKFPMFEKINVKGDDAHPLYKTLAAEGKGAPKWNFTKYLVGKDGKLIAQFGSRAKPESDEMIKAIETALASD